MNNILGKLSIDEYLNTQLPQSVTEIYVFLKDEVKDLWKKEDTEFLKQISEDLARERILAQVSENSQQHIQNIQHLIATVEGEIVRREIQLTKLGKKVFVRVLTTALKGLSINLIKFGIAAL